MKKFLVKIIPCFIPVRGVRRRVRKRLREYAGLVRTDAIVTADVAPVQSMENEYNQLKQEWAKRLSEPLIPARFTEYDLVFAIGAACPMSFLLRWHKLRTFSSPFDWTAGVSPKDWTSQPDVWRDSRFKEKINALCNDFEDYFKPEDVKLFSSDISASKMLPIANVRTHIRFLHLFRSDITMEMQMDEICKKMEKKEKRLLDAIDNSERILICWCNRMFRQVSYLDAPVSDEEVRWALAQLQQKWPGKEFDIVFFEHDGAMGRFEFDKVHVCGGAYRIRSNHFLREPAYAARYKYWPEGGDAAIWHQPVNVVTEALDNIRLTPSKSENAGA